MKQFVRKRASTGRSMLVAIIATAAAFSPFSAHALLSDDNSLIEGAKLCTRYLPRHEREYGIPVHLLAAIASTESGRYHKALGLNLPWPWTINVEGKGYFFDTKEEAIAAVQQFQSRGYQSIDVGCMQVNLHHHPYAFANLDQAFDPAYNVAYAAQFLKQNFQDEGNWRKATADYHSHTPMYGAPYANLVYNAWSRIINKIADARAGRPILNASATQSPVVRYHDKAGERQALAIINRAQGSYHAPHMREISVSNDTTREKGVLVVRPDYNIEPQQQAKLDDSFVAKPADELTPVASAEPQNKGAQVVKINGGRVVSAKGQFDPHAHIIHVGDTTASAATAPSAPVGGSDSKPGKNIFVFDN